MKKFTILSLISAGLIAGNVRADSMKVAETTASAPVITSGAGKVIKDNVNVRVRADKAAEILVQLKKGDSVEVKERKGDWLCIVAPAHAKCFASAKLLKAGVVTSDAVNVRGGPGMNFKEIGKLTKGEKVDVIETKGEWAQIKPTSNCVGWVAVDLVEILPPTPTPAPIQVIDTTPLAQPVVPTLLPVPTTASAPVAVTGTRDDVYVQYVVKDGYLAAVKEPNAPAAYALMTENIMRREYIIAYLDAPANALSRYEGKHVRILGNQRWKRSERTPVIAVERCEIIW